MIPYNITSVLPFYSNIQEQNHRRSYAYGEVYPLYCPMGEILPFQFMTPHNNLNSVVSVKVMNMHDEEVADITTALQDGGMATTKYASDGYDIVMYPAIMPMGVNLPEGRYYLVINTSVGVYYSEVFTCVGSIAPYLKIEWKSQEDLISYGWRIQYTSGSIPFHNVLYLDTELGKPDYVFEEQGESRDGYFFAEKQISEKTYKFQFLAPEYLCDALRFARMADEVIVTDKYGRRYQCDTFLITPKWQDQGDLASVEAEFQTDTIAKTIGRAIVPSAAGGDFNNDYNNDFNN